VTKTSMRILQYFTEMASGVKRRTATIEARTQEGTVIARWALTGVIPVRWTGPQLSADSPKVATETLELAHHGFLAPGAGG
jgi:phage tail-like protein